MKAQILQQSQAQFHALIPCLLTRRTKTADKKKPGNAGLF
jgi:hypothetical protein